MTNDTLDILIHRYATGDDLSAEERERVERELDGSAAANEALAAEHRLTELLRTGCPLPAIDYDALARHLCAAVPMAPAQPGHGAASADFVVAEPAATASRSFWLRRSTLAIAASVLLAAGVAIPMLSQSTGPNATGPNVTSPNGIGATASSSPIMIRATNGGPSVAQVPAGSTTEITIGPSPAIAGQPAAQRYADREGQRPSQVVIAGEQPTTQDSPLGPR